MPDIYDQHKAAFARVSAYVILRNGERVATIAFKFPADGAGRLYAYVHWLGARMVRGSASGYGYDKRTAACAAAAAAMPGPSLLRGKARPVFYQTTDWNAPHYVSPDCVEHYDAFRYALGADRGPTWDRALEAAGFTVLQSV
jgi:hypothetical protein